eukprot:8986936-Karenia_brevis.AAC.1
MALTPKERKRWRVYKRMYPGEAADVNQDPKQRPMRTRNGKMIVDETVSAPGKMLKNVEQMMKM